jgi:hypothetical protein
VLKKRPFHMPAVNTLFNALQNPQFRALDFSHLCVSQAGGMAASEGTAKQWQKVTGSTMIEGWGMSETCAIGTNNPVNSTTFTGTIGLPLPGIDIAIKDDDGNSLPQGESGEICIRGPNVMPGYYNQPEENAKAFTADGFMRTGDIGIMDAEGYTRIIDRKKDMILVSGFNVFPNELENVISLCPGVLECAAVGVPDEKRARPSRSWCAATLALTEATWPLLPREPHRLQAAQVHRVPRRAAQDQRGQDPAPRAAVNPLSRLRRALLSALRAAEGGHRQRGGAALARRSLAGPRPWQPPRFSWIAYDAHPSALPARNHCLRTRLAVVDNILFTGQHSGAALVDTGYCTHSAQTLALVQSALGGRPLERISTPTCTATTAAATPRCSRPGRRCTPPSRPARQRACAPLGRRLSYTPTGQECPRSDATPCCNPAPRCCWATALAGARRAGPRPAFRRAVRAAGRIHLGRCAVGERLWRGLPRARRCRRLRRSGRHAGPDRALAPHRDPRPRPGVHDAPRALAVARRRLDGFANNPGKHALYAAKVLLKYKLLEWQRISLPDLRAWMTPRPTSAPCTSGISATAARPSGWRG